MWAQIIFQDLKPHHYMYDYHLEALHTEGEKKKSVLTMKLSNSQLKHISQTLSTTKIF